MLFEKTSLAGPRLITPESINDERGFFARTFCEREFTVAGLPTHFPQHSISFNRLRATVRGMHYQEAPDAEAKVVRCVAGAIVDVIVDVRRESATFGKWTAFELTAHNRHQLYIPEGFAHGFQTLADDTEVSYMISAFHAPHAARGFRYDDPTVAISWPLPVAMISQKDLDWPAFPG